MVGLYHFTTPPSQYIFLLTMMTSQVKNFLFTKFNVKGCVMTDLNIGSAFVGFK